MSICRKVRKNEGVILAETYSTLFAEVSAAAEIRDGSVEDALNKLAKVLLQREDLDMQRAINLVLEAEQDGSRKKKCCGGGGRRK